MRHLYSAFWRVLEIVIPVVWVIAAIIIVVGAVSPAFASQRKVKRTTVSIPVVAPPPPPWYCSRWIPWTASWEECRPTGEWRIQ